MLLVGTQLLVLVYMQNIFLLKQLRISPTFIYFTEYAIVLYRLPEAL
jgi:hypothetical protein